jgi:hypothetical protein
MNNDEKAKKLLAESYRFSAQRILEAMQGGLRIQNSREPTNPPASNGVVVGLCGQGGRHPYFQIPATVLETALNRILGQSATTSSSNSEIEEITLACQDLRQQTYFDTGTGCVNDKLPSMVPLLPPEEIWFDGRELPLDIWRLVSFEFDLVSSAVSSQVSVQDFAFSAVNQSALAFRFLIGQLGNRRVSFQVKLQSIPTTWISGLNQSFSIDVSLARLFFEAGSLLTPLANQDFIKWYAAIRYSHWIDELALDLRVKNEFDRDSVDCRYRGLFAEEMAIGLMAVVLSEVFGAKPINNTVEVLPRISTQPSQLMADFIAQATNPTNSEQTTIIAESKGSLRSGISKARQDRAKKQLAATNLLFNGTVRTLPLAFGSTICFTTQSQQTRCLVTDPPQNPESESMKIDPVHAWRVAYAKAFKFIGMEATAHQIISGHPAESIRPIDFDRERDRKRSERDFQRIHRAGYARQRFGMELVLDAGLCAVSVDQEVLHILRHGINAKSHVKISKMLDFRRKQKRDQFHGASFETSLGIGCISYEDLDEEWHRQK